jgi:palmitoyltransferase ZDHHC6
MTFDFMAFSILVGLLYWNYFMSVVTDPGGVPHSWVRSSPDECVVSVLTVLLSFITQKPEGDDYEVKKLTGGPRYCRSCEKFKPPRAHHCRQCHRYVRSFYD